ncbi:ribose transport system ATP-binding protein [Scopulibacillus daqui]|uniref:Ribose transport system ATP-binding protein n=1 Tax=Scopulibacillus daqui TaxID=1469162 RepID=A0ABS2Q2P7_9BACL|nr:sugar ABC transporter ATP-binding protein [Scopulibacillus daqui]MBM7646572.1 ribose transport system ATP-binding protein [Scopulibacillus daqui]
MSIQALLELRNISKSFSGNKVIKNISFSVLPGEVHVLLGENGAGKSTLIKMMTGAYTIDEGEMYWNSKPVKFSGPADAMEYGIATVYQELNLIPELTVCENIFLGRELKKGARLLDRTKMRERAKNYLKRLGQNIDPDKKISELGVGQQQLVEIAKAFTVDAKLIIMDEPTASLSETETEQLLQTVDELIRQGISIVYISHKINELMEIGDRITILRDGAKVDTLDVKETSQDELIELMVGRALDEKYPKRPSLSMKQEGLRIENLKLKNSQSIISFSAYQGEILGISGLVGAGRTEMARAIFGADEKNSGDVYVFGKKVNIKKPKDAIAAGFAFITEDRKGEGLFLDQSLAFNINIASMKNYKKGMMLSNRELLQSAGAYIKALRVNPQRKEEHARNLSGGNQQKIVIAKWLATKAKIFIFDEPTRGIDVGAKVEVYRLINQLVQEGAVVMIISSELPELMGMCDRILVMNEGTITADLKKEEANQEIIMKAATGGK